MKMLRKILILSALVAGLSAAAFAQKDDKKAPPKEKPPVINPGSKNPPPKQPEPKKRPGGDLEAAWIREES